MVTAQHIHSSKAGNLKILKDNGFPVPDFIVIGHKATDAMLAPVRSAMNQLLATADKENLSAVGHEMQKLITSAKIPATLMAQVRKDCNEMFGPDYRIAVRSSALLEDTVTSSFAGQMETYLQVTDEMLEDRIIHCLASSWSFNAMQYRSMNGFNISDGQMEVILQRMIDASVSGVLFTMNPNGNLNDTVIIAGRGSGEGVVGGTTDTDQYFVDRSDVGIRIQPVEDQPLIGSSVVTDLFRFGQKAESIFHTGQDMEFSIDNAGIIWMLQSRPITGIAFDDLKIADNSNIVESYPGITLPLSFTFARRAYEMVFTATMRAFGIPGKIAKANKHVLSELLTYHNGRVYYRLDNWYRMVSFAFSSKKQLHQWEKNLGIPRSESSQIRIGFNRKLKSLFMLLRLIFSYRRKNRRFYAFFRKHYKDLVELPDNTWDNKALFTFYRTKGDLLFNAWSTTQINDFIAFKAFSAMQAMLARYGFDEDSGMANDLMCGIPGVESELPMLRLLELKSKILADNALAGLFRSNQPNDVLNRLAEPAYSTFRESFFEYIARYGDRTLEELKLETPSLKHDPHILIVRLQQQLDTELTVEKVRATQSSIRDGAEDQLKVKLKWYQPANWYLHVLIRISRYGLKNRENMRLARTRSYGAVKDIFLLIAERMTRDRVVDTPRDIFYLDEQDVEQYCIGGDTTPLLLKVAERKKAIKSYRAMTMPNRIIYTGDQLPILNNDLKNYQVSENVFKGTPVSKGKVQAPVVVLDMPDHNADVKGKIMITRMTDPGWLFLMSQAKGLISEKGSLLSHTAIVGRELGLPTIVGVDHATRIFKDGQMVTMDGATGLIERMAKEL